MSVAATQKNAKFYIGVQSLDTDAPEAQDADLNQTAFEALTWQEVGGTGKFPQFGTIAEMVSYDEFGQGVRQRAKGIPDAGEDTHECREIVTDNGQIAMKVAGGKGYASAIAIKIEYDDMPSGGTTNTIAYSRAKISGPRRTNTAPQDFVVLQFNVGFVQDPIEVVAT